MGILQGLRHYIPHYPLFHGILENIVHIPGYYGISGIYPIFPNIHEYYRLFVNINNKRE